jgi:hypothetical protein
MTKFTLRHRSWWHSLPGTRRKEETRQLQTDCFGESTRQSIEVLELRGESIHLLNARRDYSFYQYDIASSCVVYETHIRCQSAVDTMEETAMAFQAPHLEHEWRELQKGCEMWVKV